MVRSSEHLLASVADLPKLDANLGVDCSNCLRTYFYIFIVLKVEYRNKIFQRV
jgi:hypothetical protein